MVELILRRDVENLGLAGEVVDVKPGYARNYLLPQGMAYEATAANLQQLENVRASLNERRTRDLEQAQELAGRIEATSLKFQVRAGEAGRLFGSVSATDIVTALAARGVEVERHLMRLEQPIKQLGDYQIPIRLHAQVTAEASVSVVAED